MNGVYGVIDHIDTSVMSNDAWNIMYLTFRPTYYYDDMRAVLTTGSVFITTSTEDELIYASEVDRVLSELKDKGKISGFHIKDDGTIEYYDDGIDVNDYF